jgi:uncharacterized protein
MKIKTIKSYLVIFILIFSITGLVSPVGAQDFPEPMNPPRMVNDFSGFLGTNEAGSLERKLQDFYYNTSTQIYIIVVDDLKGYDPADYATQIGEKWEVGTEDKDNGIVILVKPKTQSSNGEVFIAVAYGLEGVVPDITANHIVKEEILPRFQQGDFYGGLNSATDVLIELTKGEYTADEYIERTGGGRGASIPGIIFLIFIAIAIFGGGRGSRRNSSIGRNLPFWLLLGMMGSGSRSHGGSWGGFSGGSGGFGGFGGGGGGSFGGGGAGGSW